MHIDLKHFNSKPSASGDPTSKSPVSSVISRLSSRAKQGLTASRTACRATNQKDIVFFDVETPNRHNDRICALGAIRVSPSGQTLCSRYWLINPDAAFDEINIKVHGITPIDVMNEPSFADLWANEIYPVFRNANLVAHNAQFDLHVLAKVLSFYGLHLEETSYICTVQTARSYMPGCPNYKLDTLSGMLGVPLDHHNAFSDTNACMALFYYMVRYRGMLPEAQWSRYDPQSIKIDSSKSSRDISNIEKEAESTTAKFPDMVERNAADVDVRGKVICLTGDFVHSPGYKKPIEEYLIDRGAAEIVKSVTLKCDLLVVGQLGSSRWKHGSYGSKIERAIELAESGKTNIRIVDEASVLGSGF